VDDLLRPPAPTVRHALGAIAETAIDQARDLVVGHLDHLVERVCERLTTSTEEAAPAPSGPVTPLLAGIAAGAFIGATGAWLLARHQSKP
jgi:hypothetical protein